MTNKICIRCGVEKDISLFHKNKKSKDGYRAACAECCNLYTRTCIPEEKKRAYKKKSLAKPEIKKKIKEYHIKYNQTEKYIEYHKNLRKTEKSKLYHRKYNTTQKYRDKKNQYRIDNYDLVRGRERIREVEYNKRPEVRIKRALRARLLVILKRGEGSKSCKMVELVGCTMPFLREYLESLWREGMSWDNYGFGRECWVMDHIIPCDRFNLTDKDEQKRCFNYTNIQPLWWDENASKSNK